jgi:predicted RNA-binding Zn-ribbon protein involved in translation (DUF1610 family)
VAKDIVENDTELDEKLKWIYEHYGNDLGAFFRDARASALRQRDANARKKGVGTAERIAPFEEAMKSECADCGRELIFMEDFDSDGVPYTAECCGHWYRLRPVTVTVSREKVAA